MSNYLDLYNCIAVRKTTPLGRAYYDPNEESDNPYLALSVTTILGLVIAKGNHFDKWLKTNGRYADTIRDYKGHLGTAVHLLSEELFNGREVSPAVISKVIHHHLSDRDIREGGGVASIINTTNLYLESLCKFWDDHDCETLGTEVQMFASGVPYAGTGDWIGTVNGEHSLLDIKTGAEVSTHDYQLVAYGMLHNYLFPKNKVTKLYTLYLKGAYRLKPTYKLVDVSWALSDDWRRILKLGLSIHGKGGAWKFPKRFEPRETFKLTKTKGAK